MRTFLLFVSILLAFSLSAITPSLKFYRITHEQGLSQSNVNAILKDAEGYYWFCTGNGLNKWNGYEFKYYFNSSDDPNSIGLGRVNTILEDSENNLWIGTNEGGISKYLREYDHFVNYPLKLSMRDNIEYNNVTSILQIENNLLVGTFNKGLFVFNISTEQYQPVNIILADGEKVSELIDMKLFVDRDSILWVGSTQGAIMLSLKDFISEKSPTEVVGKMLLSSQNVLHVFQDSQDNIWLGTFQDGAYIYNKNSSEYTHISAGALNGKQLNHSIVRSIIEDPNGNIWIGTGGGGLNIYNPVTKEIKYYIPHFGDKYSIGSNIIYSLYQDDDSNIWVGTYNGGVSHTNWYKQFFNHTRSFGAPGEVNNNSILSFCEVEDKVWIGTDGGGINIFDKENNTHTLLEIPPYKMPKVNTSLANDGKGNIYIGTYRKGLFIYNLHTRKVKRFSEEQGVFGSNDIWGITVDEKKGVVWLATLGGGLIKYIPRTESFLTYTYNPDINTSISENYQSSLLVDENGNLWIGTLHRGLCLMKNGEDGVFHSITKENSAMVSNEVRAIFQDSKGRVLVGNQDGGLSVFNMSGKLEAQFDVDDGLPSNTVVGIVEDTEGKIWLSTTRGISQAVIEDNKIKSIQNYSAIDGLQANEFNPNAALQTKSGFMFFGGVNGYNAFNPSDLIEESKVGNVVLTGMQIFDRELLPGEPDSPLEKGLSNTNKISLDYNHSTLTFKYALLDYNVSELNTYEYRLLGFEEEWVKAGTLRRATYTNLDPGTYHFEVRGYNSRGVMSENTLSLEVFIKPPYYQTLLFRLFLLLLIISLLLSIYRFRVRTLHVKGDLLKVMVEERTKELQNVNKVLENRNREINEQSEILMEQQAKILASNKELEDSYRKIEQQNVELESHRYNLEEIVKERTLELEKAKLKAEESEQLKMAFLSNMSHEIRTPMNAIVGFASLLSDVGLTDSEKEEYIRQVNKNSDSLLLLIDDILDLSKIEANQLLITPTVFEVNNFINELFFNWQHIQQSANNQVNLLISNKLKSKEVKIKSDEHRLKQVLNNLLDNAFKFTSMGEVEIGLSEKGEDVLFTVRDTGIGIHEKHLDQIFNRFRKGDTAGRKLYRGAGLGLAISNKLIELLGGKLWVESEIDKGSMFSVTLPMESISELTAEVTERVYENANEVDLTGVSALIAEDEEANYYYLEGVLERKGVQVDWAKNGEEALKKVSINTYDVILMDIKMPVMDGVEATKKIKAMFPDQVIIAQTAFARPEEETEFRKAGFNEYVTKPIKKNNLICLIERFRS